MIVPKVYLVPNLPSELGEPQSNVCAGCITFGLWGSRKKFMGFSITCLEGFFNCCKKIYVMQENEQME